MSKCTEGLRNKLEGDECSETCYYLKIRWMIYAPSAALMHLLTNAYAFMDFSFQLAVRCFCLQEEEKIPDTELRHITHCKPSAAHSWPFSHFKNQEVPSEMTRPPVHNTQVEIFFSSTHNRVTLCRGIMETDRINKFRDGSNKLMEARIQ